MATDVRGPFKLPAGAGPGKVLTSDGNGLGAWASPPGLGSVASAVGAVAGSVNADGTVRAGSGFTVAKGGTGIYVVTFTTPMNQTPAVIAFPGNTVGTRVGKVRVNTNAATTGFTVNFYDVSNLAINTDNAFEFIAMEAGAGSVGLYWRGTWAAGTAYNVNDTVYYAGSSYRRLVSGTTATAPNVDTTNWAVISRGLNARGEWNAGVYGPGDTVTYGLLGTYVCILTTTIAVGPPNTNPTYWTLIAAPGPAGANGVDGLNGLLAVQTDYGVTNAYVTIPTTEYAIKQSGTYLQINYTPTVNCWWEVLGNVLVRADTASYNGCEVGIKLLGTDGDGNASPTRGTDYAVQHSTVNSHLQRHPGALFKLTAGVAYSARIQLVASVGAWSILQGGAQYLHLTGKAWAR